MKRILFILLLLSAFLCLACASAEEAPAEYHSGKYVYILLEDGTAEIVFLDENVTELVIPDTLDGYTVSSIGDDAFSYHDSLTAVTIPDSVTAIGDCAFSGCSSITEFVIPDTVVSIGANPFMDCHALTKISVSPDHPVLATIDGVLFHKEEKRLIAYPSTFTEEQYAVPQGIVSIGDYAFYDCQSLTAIQLPDSVASIGIGAFSGCDGLIEFSLPDGLLSIGDGAFYGCDSLSSLSLPDSLTTLGASPFGSCRLLTKLHVSPDHPVFAVIDGVLFKKKSS